MNTFESVWSKFESEVDPYEVVRCGLDSFSPYSYVDHNLLKKRYTDLYVEIESLDDTERKKFDERETEWVQYDLINGGPRS